MKSSYHLAGETIHAYHFSYWVFDTKELIPHGPANRAHIRGPIHVVLREDCPLIDVPAFYFEVLRRNASIGRVPILIAVDYLDRIIHIRRNALDERYLILYGNGIGHHQGFRIVSARAHAVDRP